VIEADAWSRKQGRLSPRYPAADGKAAVNSKPITWLLALGRCGLGVAMFLAPGRMGRGWFGEAADHPATQLAVRGLAVRDLALGIGAAQALVREGDTTRWTHAGMLADTGDTGDTGDAAATLLARRHLSTASVVGVVALAGGAAAAGAWSQLRA
jgi:hypothetical protein